MIPYSELTEEQFDDIGYFGHKLIPRETGIDIDIWVTVKPFWDDISVPYLIIHGHIDEWIKVDTPYVEISIEDEPRIISEKNHTVSAEHFKQVSDWVKLNKDYLIKQWTLEYDTMDFHQNMKKIKIKGNKCQNLTELRKHHHQLKQLTSLVEQDTLETQI